jgi:hypothetical protein
MFEYPNNQNFLKLSLSLSHILGEPLKYDRVILFCHNAGLRKRFYCFRIEDIGFDVRYFQKGGLSDKLRKKVFVLLKIDVKPTAYSIFAKIESGIRGSTVDQYLAKLEDEFRKEMKAHNDYPKKKLDVYCHFVATYFYKICQDWVWKKAHLKWEPKRHSTRGQEAPGESSVDEVRL